MNHTISEFEDRALSKCGRGLAPDSGVSANSFASHATAIEASLKLDISHSGSALPVGSPTRHFQPVEHESLWEGACSR
jgi:hypothetical protein